MASHISSTTEHQSAGSMSFVFYLLSLIPKSDSKDPIIQHLFRQFPTHFSAVIPNKLGRISNAFSHKQEYLALTGPLPAAKAASFLPSIKQVQRSPVKQPICFNHRRLHRRAPGVIRITPRLGKSLMLRTMKYSSPLFEDSFEAGFQTPVKQRNQRHSSMLGVVKEIESYTGDVAEGLRHGKGTALYINGDKYKGGWFQDSKHGYGVHSYKSIGIKYKGDWSMDKRHGEGTLWFKNGDRVTGTWEEGQLTNNRAMVSYKDQSVYEGEMVNCERSGAGVMNYEASVMYKGEWLNDLREGHGALLGSTFFYEGSFKQDTTESPGVLVLRKAILDKNSHVEPIVDFTMHESFNGSFDMFSQQELTSSDIIYMAVTLQELRQTASPPGTLSDGVFMAGKLNGCGIAKYGAFGVYHGNFVDGRRSGWGKMKYIDPNFSCLWTHQSEGEYTGQWLNDQRQGFGSMVWPNSIRYEGNFSKDRRHQVTGTMWFITGEVYTGGWVDNMMQGFGCLTGVSGTCFKGQFVKGKALGRGALQFLDNNKYEGEVSMFEAHGKGRMEYLQGDVYEGDFIRGQPSGRGKMKYANGDVYEGEWEKGIRNGEGVFVDSKSKEVYRGGWKNNEREGFGCLEDPKGRVIYEGEWANSKRMVN